MTALQNILVTGAEGFIGSHYARLLYKYRYNIFILDKRTYAADKRRVGDIKCKVFVCDINDKQAAQYIIGDNDVDTIVNFAAESHVDNSIKDSSKFVHSNITGVWNLLEIVRSHNDNLRFVQIGTDEVYGSIREGSFKEIDKINPSNPYSATKASADLLALSYYNTYGLYIIITRSSNNYGPYQDKEKFIPRMIDLAIKGKPLEVYGNGNNIRDWLYVSDNCEAIKLVMEKGKKGEIYNIGANNEMTNNQIAELISDRFGVGIRYIEDRKGHDHRYSINCTKIKEELGWKHVTKFEDGLEKTIDWYIKEEHKKDLEATMGYD